MYEMSEGPDCVMILILWVKLLKLFTSKMEISSAKALSSGSQEECKRTDSFGENFELHNLPLGGAFCKVIF